MAKQKITTPEWLLLTAENEGIFDLRMHGGPLNALQAESEGQQQAENVPDLVPKDSDFIFPQFRAISARYLGPNGGYQDFSEPGVLESAVKLFMPRSQGGARLDNLKLVRDHRRSIDDIIGTIISA